jgi:hypothetical protein
MALFLRKLEITLAICSGGVDMKYPIVLCVIMSLISFSFGALADGSNTNSGNKCEGGIDQLIRAVIDAQMASDAKLSDAKVLHYWNMAKVAKNLAETLCNLECIDSNKESAK